MHATKCTDIHEVQRLIATHLPAGIAIEPLYTGDTLIITKSGEAVSVVVDENMVDISDGCADLRAEIAELDGDLVMIAKSGHGCAVVTDLVYCGESMAGMWHADRRLELEALLAGRDFDTLRLSPSTVAKSMSELDAAVDEIQLDDGSRGVVCKAMTSRYMPGESDEWAALETACTLNVMVVKRTAKAVTCAIGPVETPEDWRDTAAVGDAHYAVIGKIEGKHAVKKGDTMAVSAMALCEYKYSDGQRGLSWHAPIDAVQKAEGEALPCDALEAAGFDYIEQGEAIKQYVMKSEEERYVLFIVLEPLKGDGDVDAQKDKYNKPEVRKAFFYWTEKGRKFGLMHKQLLKDSDVTLCENYLAPVDFNEGGQSIREGTWLMGTRINSDAIWADIKSGKLTGVSIGGYATRTQA